ncbi:hypothetical protein [Alsobacter sp. SYSU BS001988]
MSLQFERRPAKGRLARGLASEPQETFTYVYAGAIEFGHYFRVSTSRGVAWRWEAVFPVFCDTAGEMRTEEEVREIFRRLYDDMLRLAGLRERRRQPRRRSPAARRPDAEAAALANASAPA